MSQIMEGQFLPPILDALIQFEFIHATIKGPRDFRQGLAALARENQGSLVARADLPEHGDQFFVQGHVPARPGLGVLDEQKAVVQVHVRSAQPKDFRAPKAGGVVIAEEEQGTIILRPAMVMEIDTYTDKDIALWDAEDRLNATDREAILNRLQDKS